jgi:hypothetical protein
MGEWWEVYCKSRFINRWIAGAMNPWARYTISSLCESEQCKNITQLGFATGPTLDWTDRSPIRSNHGVNNYRQQQIWMNNTLQWVSTERQWFMVLYVRYFTSNLVFVIHNGRIGSSYRWPRQQHIVLATVPYLEQAGFKALHGNGLTTSNMHDFWCELLH